MKSRWMGVFALLILIVIAYVDRVNISVMLVNEDFLATFNLINNRAWQGGLMTAFLLGYGLSAFIPFIMGIVIQHQSSISSGFSVLILSQVVTCIAGIGLWIRMNSGEPIVKFW